MVTTLEKKKAQVDLLIIVSVTMAVLGAFVAIQSSVENFVRDASVNILLRTVVMASLQFGTAGLGITIVALYRKESFLRYGLKRDNTLLSIAFCTLAYVPNIIFGYATRQIDSYFPFQSVWMTKELLDASFPAGIFGYLIVAVAWGFFEGFNYVVISEKINTILPTRRRWLNWGAITSAIACILIHGLVGVTAEGIVEMLTVFIIIYGMLVAKALTGNAWGCVFVFVFLWNAFK